MPFKLKLKKTRQYNVASKSLFVISVELLDGGVADCTLSVDSSGQECLDNVCQRQAINQPEFFGLRYVNRSQQPRWVQLERPLKRQLDKYASSHQLYLRVMYYVISGTSLITDEVTRDNYFLQLKNDLVEGRIICDCQQAVVLASYSRQAEYGNHDRERHTVEYLKNLLTFPKQILDGGQIIDGSTLAETGRLEWLTAAVIQHHMSLHNMSQAQAEEGFITTCQQLRGYGQEMFSARDQLTQSDVTIAISLTGIRVLTETSDTPHFYRWMDITNVINHKRTFSIECQKQSESASFVLSSPEHGKYVWRMCVQQHTFYMRHREALSETPHEEPTIKFQEHGLSESREELDVRETGSTPRLQPLTPAHRAHSTSCLELNDQPPQPMQRNRALLPQYRPAPDYETAIQQKYQQQRAPAPLRYQAALSGSHPDMRRAHFPELARHRVPPPVAVDDFAYAYNLLPAGYPYAVNPAMQAELGYYKPPPPYPANGLASNSTPDLAAASQALGLHRARIASHVSGSSPDLVSARSALVRRYPPYAAAHLRPGPAHGTYGDLASALALAPDAGDIYSVHAQYRRHPALPRPQRTARPAPPTLPGETQEPIYENVPLPWRYDTEPMRARARSLTATDERIRRDRLDDYCGHVGPPPPGALSQLAMNRTVDADAHYVNAQMIKNARESSLPREPSVTTRSGVEAEFENVTLAVDRLSLRRDEKDDDETPYQSLSTHRVSADDSVSKSVDNVTSISIGGRITDTSGDISAGSGADSALSNSTMTSVELSNGGDVSKVMGAKEKKRRRWGMFMGRAPKPAEVKSATLGRDRAKVTGQQVANKHRWSTGLHKFQPLPPSITKETLCQLLERKMSEDQLSFAFEQIPKGRESGGEVRTALLPQHAPLNAYSTDNLPYEDNRVRLTPTVDNPHGYINASHVTMTVGSSQRFYVVIHVGQGRVAPPLGAGAGGAAGARVGAAGARSDADAVVWECLWQTGARVVALVGEGDAHYLPTDNTTQDYGKFQVSCMSSSVAAWGASVRVRVACGGRARALWHVHYRAWGQNSNAPDATQQFLEFLSELNGLRLACEAEASTELGGVRGGRGRAGVGAVGAISAPLVVGEKRAGRAGLVLAADLLLHALDSSQEIDIPRTISLLHQQRANLIQNVQQYKFLHQVLLQYLKQSRLI